MIYKAIDKTAHNGYQTWHRDYDSKVVKWLSTRLNATPKQFKDYLNKLYSEDWLKERIPNVTLK